MISNSFNQDLKIGDIIAYSWTRKMRLGVFRGHSTLPAPLKVGEYPYDRGQSVSMRVMEIYYSPAHTWNPETRRYDFDENNLKLEIQKTRFLGMNNFLKLDDNMIYSLFDRELANWAKRVQAEVLAGRHK